jgi:uncharacterized protein YndB with AHSA1/START domain
MSDAEQETPHELILRTRFDAPPEAVWAAWTDPELFARWWCGPGWRTHDVVLEARPRGRFSAKQAAPDGSVDMPFDGFYRDVVPHERLVLTLSDSPSPDDPARTEMTVLLRPVDGGTEQEFHQTGVITDAHFEGLKAGTELFFGQLDALLRERA